jgi:hypothetical protein
MMPIMMRQPVCSIAVVEISPKYQAARMFCAQAASIDDPVKGCITCTLVLATTAMVVYRGVYIHIYVSQIVPAARLQHPTKSLSSLVHCNDSHIAIQVGISHIEVQVRCNCKHDIDWGFAAQLSQQQI